MSQGSGQSAKEAKAEARAAKARAKALRPWYRKKRIILPLAFVALIAIVAIAGGGGDNTSNTATGGGSETTAAAAGNGDDDTSSNTATGGGSATTAAAAGNDGDAQLFAGRPDSQREDQERNIGDSAKLSGYTATVVSAGFQQSVSDFEEDGYIVVDVTIENRDDKAQSYNYFDWKLQTPEGQVIDGAFVTIDHLGSGDLVNGGKVSGKVVFEVGATKGDFFIIYKPDAYDAARGIWKVTA